VFSSNSSSGLYDENQEVIVMFKQLPIVATVVTISAFLLFPMVAQADTMRCDRSLITRGDYQGEVLASCGEPVISTRKTIYRSGIPRSRFRSLSPGHNFYSGYSGISKDELLIHNRSVIEVPVETWTYNFGPRYFMREVIFTDGRVTRINTLGYGR
jgi:hypothetical protein